jgi:hypothetical protein
MVCSNLTHRKLGVFKMANINYFDVNTNNSKTLNFGDLVSLVKGASITSLAVAEDYVEFGLSDAFNMRIDAQNNITLFPTTNKGEAPPVRLTLIMNDETPTAQIVESRIRALRQIYAITFLIDAGRESEIATALNSGSPVDLEDLIDTENKLFVKSASEGSFWLTVATKTAAAFKSITRIAPLFFDEGRQAVLERVRANTELTKLDVDKKRLEIHMQKANGLIDEPLAKFSERGEFARSA